jgi:hypothetical protein
MVAEQYDALVELLPDLGQRYEVAASKVTAEFFSELQQMQGVRRPVSPVELDPVSRASWQALAGWSTSGKTLAEQTANDVFFGLLSGGFTRRLTEAASDTMVENASVQGGMRYQRVPAPGCCSFCAMLASRGGSYTSRESATKVVGRGQSVEYRRRGGAKETRPRGSQKLGQTFHDAIAGVRLWRLLRATRSIWALRRKSILRLMSMLEMRFFPGFVWRRTCGWDGIRAGIRTVTGWTRTTIVSRRRN